MTETTAADTTAAAPVPSLPARLIGVVFSPRDTYAAVAAQPRWFGAMAVAVLIIGLAQAAFLSSEVGQAVSLDQQVQAVEGFGVTVSDEMYTEMEARIEQSWFVSPLATMVAAPLVTALFAGLLLVIFTMMLGGNGTFRQIYALLAHAAFITALQQLFVFPLSYAAEAPAGANLGLLVPMLAEDHVLTLFLGTIDLFYVWWFISVAIGLGVLYRRRTGPIAAGLLTIYGLIALVIAVIRA